jgi:predicted ATPase
MDKGKYNSCSFVIPGSSNDNKPSASSVPSSENATVSRELQAPQISGAYLWGPVGSGKTMCLNLFYQTLQLSEASSFTLFQGDQQVSVSHASPSHSFKAEEPGAPSSSANDEYKTRSQNDVPKPSSNKRRLHFHEFMLQVHQRLHTLQQCRSKVLGKSRLGLPVYR